MAAAQVLEPIAVVHEIGEIAGQVWRELSANGPQTLTTLQKRTGISAMTLHLALGWLAREDKIELAPAGKSFSVRLK